MNSHGLDFISFKVICLVSSFELVCHAAATIFLVLLEYDAAYSNNAAPLGRPFMW